MQQHSLHTRQDRFWPIVHALILVALLMPSVASGQLRRERAANRQLTAGVAAYEDGLYDAAQRFFERALDQSANEKQAREARLWLLRALFQGGEYAAILSQLDQTVLATVDRADIGLYRFWRAHACYALQQYAAAIDELNGVDPEVLEPPEAGRRLRLFGRAYLQTTRYDSARRVFDLYDRQFPDGPEAAENQLDRVDLLLQTGESETAIDQLARLLSDFPQTASARTGRLWLGLLMMQRGQYESAMTHLRALTQSDQAAPELVADAWRAMAHIYEAEGDWTAAADALSQVETLAPTANERRQGTLNRGRMLFKVGDWELGQEVLRPLTAQREDPILAGAAQLLIAESWLEQQRFEESLAAYQVYLDAFEDPRGRAQAWLGRAWSLLGLERPTEAARAFEQAYLLQEDVMDRAAAWFKVADAYFLQGNYVRARKEYRVVAEQFTDTQLLPMALFQAAESLARSGEVTRALEELTLLESQYPGSVYAAQAAMRAGSLNEELGQWERAIAGYQRVIVGYPDAELQAPAWHRRGLIQYRLREYKDALNDFEAVLGKYAAQPQAEQAFYMRGWCLYLLGEDERALAVASAFLVQYPLSVWRREVLFWLATYHFNHDQFAEAEKRFLAVADDAPGDALADRALYWAARSATAQESYRSAIEYLSRLTRVYPRSPKIPESRLLQGDALILLGEYAGAILAYEEIIRAVPEEVIAVAAWGRKGDAQFTLGTDTPARHEAALISYQAVLDHPQASASYRVQAEYKMGRTLEIMGRVPEALDRYLQVVYDFELEPDPALMAEASVWFTRSAFAAAHIREAAGDGPGAIQLYERVATAPLAAAADARRRIAQVERKRLESDDQ